MKIRKRLLRLFSPRDSKHGRIVWGHVGVRASMGTYTIPGTFTSSYSVMPDARARWAYRKPSTLRGLLGIVFAPSKEFYIETGLSFNSTVQIIPSSYKTSGSITLTRGSNSGV